MHIVHEFNNFTCTVFLTCFNTSDNKVEKPMEYNANNYINCVTAPCFQISNNFIIYIQYQYQRLCLLYSVDLGYLHLVLSDKALLYSTSQKGCAFIVLCNRYLVSHISYSCTDANTVLMIAVLIALYTVVYI